MVDTTGPARVVSNEGGQISASRSQYSTFGDPQSLILDRQWVQNAFLVPDTQFTEMGDRANRYWSSAEMKFTDSRLGANIGINPRPQFCFYSDVPVAGRIQRRKPSINSFTGNYGMGRQYSEMIDDPAQRIYMTFGVPQYNSLFGFFRGAYNKTQMSLARTGRASSAFYKAGQFAGGAALLVAFPLVAVGIVVGKLYSFFLNRPKSKYYTMKPTMPLYWNSVNQLTTALAINAGIMPRFMADEQSQIIGRPFQLDPEYLDLLSKLMPDVFRDSGLGDGTKMFDIFSVVTKAQRLHNYVLRKEFEAIDNGTATDFTGYVERTMTGVGGHPTEVSDSDGTPKIDAQIDNFLNLSDTESSNGPGLLNKFFDAMTGLASAIIPNGQQDAGMETDFRAPIDAQGTMDPEKQVEGESFLKHLEAQLRDGALFATFIVDHTGPQSESWTNSATESELAKKLNGAVNDVAEARFAIAEGQIVGGPLADAAGAVVNAVTDTATGFLDGITMGLSSVVQGLAGAGYIDVPKHWSGSNFNPTRSQYTIQLISPYGNPISQLMAIYIPIAMLLAASLPRSTGKASYTGPFLCQLFDRGRCQIRLGLVESLSITRGTSHLSFSDDAQPLAVDVNFSVMDLSSIMHMPVSGGGIFEDQDLTIDDDNILQDYLAVLTGMSLESQIYDIPRLKVKAAKVIMNASKLTSPAYWAMVAGNNTVADFMKNFTRMSAQLDVTGARY